MKTINQFSEELELARRINGDRDYFGVCYYSKSNPSNRHYVIMRNDNELTNLQAQTKDWDFIYNKLAI